MNQQSIPLGSRCVLVHVLEGINFHHYKTKYDRKKQKTKTHNSCIYQKIEYVEGNPKMKNIAKTCNCRNMKVKKEKA